MKMLRLSIAAVLVASGWALSQEAGALAGQGHPEINAAESEIRAAVE